MINTYDVFISIIPARADTNYHYHQILLTFNPDNKYDQEYLVSKLDVHTITKKVIPFNRLVIGSTKGEDTYVAKVHICYNVIEYLDELMIKLDEVKLTYNKQNLNKIK